MQSSSDQQNAASDKQDSLRQGSSTPLSALDSSVPVLQSIHSDQSVTPQVHIHISEDQEGHVSPTDASASTSSHALASIAGSSAGALRSGSGASSPTSQYAPSAGTGRSTQHTPPGIANSSSLAAPAPLPYGLSSHSGLLGGLGHPLEGRISPRPVSRNHSRASNHHEQTYREEAYGRASGDNRMQLFVGNLPFRVRWQDLKDLFRKCGSVLRSDVALTLDNRSKGFGTVLYAHEEDARNAIQTFNGYTWQSRVLDVRLDQQDPTGSISLANAAAQQAQHHAYQTHQQAMQTMANMAGVPQGTNAAAMYQQAQAHPMFGQGPGSSPWMAAANGNNFRSNMHGSGGFPQHVQPAMHSHQGGPAQYMMSGRAASPYRAVQLGNDLANMSLRRNSTSTEGSSRPSLPQSGSSSSLALPTGRVDGSTPTQASSVGSLSLPGTSPASPTLQAPSISKASSPSPIAGRVDHADSASPTSARRPPPGSLGPMPPSMFAGMPQHAQLPNPPAAAAAAVAAGYTLDNESMGPRHNTSSYGPAANRDMAPSSRRGSSTMQEPSAHPGQQLRQQQMTGLESDASVSPHNGPAPPLPGGLVNFYQQHRGAPNFPQGPAQYSPSSGRNSPAPPFADRQLFVGNIPFNCQWQDLKDLFRAAGSILRADVSLGPDGRSRGFGRVVYATPEDAINAMQMFNGYEFQGRPLKVHFDKFAPGGTPLNQLPPLHAPQSAIHHIHESQFIQPSGMNGSHYGQPHTQGPNFNANAYSNGGPRDWQPDEGGQGMSFDDNNSVPGTPIHEMSLAQMAAFPSPGFASSIQHQYPSGQSADQRRRGFNAEGVPVAPIGSGAPHAQYETRPHMQHGHSIPLSPLMIPPMSMAMPSPGPGGLFSPPLPGMGPMMTPSMPGFSFHPFPQTPPLLPHFLSPGLGPFSPPLFGTPGAFVGYNGPSSLRNSAPGGADSTPLQSPNGFQAAHQQGNYFPPLPDQPQRNVRTGAGPAETAMDAASLAVASTVPHDSTEDASGNEEYHGSTTPTRLPSEKPSPAGSTPATIEPGSSPHPEPAASTGRRSSFKEQKTNVLLDVPPTSNNRGGSLDIPRPDLKLGEIAPLAGNDSALDDGEDSTPPASSPAAAAAILDHAPEASQTKRGAWNLSWLKKQ